MTDTTSGEENAPSDHVMPPATPPEPVVLAVESPNEASAPGIAVLDPDSTTLPQEITIDTPIPPVSSTAAPDVIPDSATQPENASPVLSSEPQLEPDTTSTTSPAADATTITSVDATTITSVTFDQVTVPDTDIAPAVTVDAIPSSSSTSVPSSPTPEEPVASTSKAPAASSVHILSGSNASTTVPATRHLSSYKNPDFDPANAPPVPRQNQIITRANGPGTRAGGGRRDGRGATGFAAMKRRNQELGVGRTGFFKRVPALPAQSPGVALPAPGPYPHPKRVGWPVKSLHFGFVGRDGDFHAEYDAKIRDGHIDTSAEAEYIQITGDGFETNVAMRIVIAFDALQIVSYDAERGTCLLSLVYAPSFEIYTSHSPRDAVRVIAYDQTHRDIAPYTSRHLLLRTPNSRTIEQLVAQFARLPVPAAVPRPIEIEHRRLAYYGPEHLMAFRARMSALRPGHAFQLEAILHDGSLLPSEFVELEQMLGKLEEEMTDENSNLLNDKYKGGPGDERRIADLMEQVLVDLRRRLTQESFKRMNELVREAEAISGVWGHNNTGPRKHVEGEEEGKEETGSSSEESGTSDSEDATSDSEASSNEEDAEENAQSLSPKKKGKSRSHSQSSSGLDDELPNLGTPGSVIKSAGATAAARPESDSEASTTDSEDATTDSEASDDGEREINGKHVAVTTDSISNSVESSEPAESIDLETSEKIATVEEGEQSATTTAVDGTTTDAGYSTAVTSEAAVRRRRKSCRNRAPRSTGTRSSGSSALASGESDDDTATDSELDSEAESESELASGSDSDSGSSEGDDETDSEDEYSSKDSSAEDAGKASKELVVAASGPAVDPNADPVDEPRRKPKDTTPFDLRAELDASVYAVLKMREQMSLLPDDNHFFCHHVYITPSGKLFDGPFVEQSNAVVRKFPDATDFFLRVSFVEEDRTSLQLGRWGISKDFLTHHVYAALTQPIDLCGRYYQFLGYSQSSLRSHTAWFVAPFAREDDDKIDEMFDDDMDEDELPGLINAEFIRNSLGDFRKLAHQPTLYGARLSQGFTSSRASVSLGAELIATIPDIVHKNELGAVITNHTDGAGTMSTELRDLIWESLLRAGHQRDRAFRPPDVFQIRIGGYKGIIVRDDRLIGRTLCLRPSQNKFKAYFDNETARAYELAIAESFTRPGTLNLNRPLVSALEDLGIDKQVFVKYQSMAIEELYTKRQTFEGSVVIMQRYGLGAGSRFHRLYGALAKTGAFEELLEDEPFLKAGMDVILGHALKEFKLSARIPLPGCYNLVGVPDQDDYLEPDEIYVAVQQPGGEIEYLQGKFAITRSPTLDAGDLRVVTCVGKLPPSDPPLRIAGLVNCIVLSTRGSRSVASMMGGGDLDGDQYNVITLPDLVPKRTIAPRSHTATPPLRLEEPCTIDNVAQCFASFIEHDNVGLIATSHLRLADSSPQHGEDPLCKELADLYSIAVDFSKTGTAVPLSAIPRMTDMARPDFLSGDTHGKGVNYYESERALGLLHRAIPDEKIAIRNLDKNIIKDSSSEALLTIRAWLLSDAQAQFGFIPLELTPGSALEDIAKRHRLAFTSHLYTLAETANFPRRPGSRLSEIEVFVGTNMARVDRDKRGHKNSIANLQQQLTALVDALDSTIGRNLTVGDQFAALWACWEEALNVQYVEFGVKSYRWILCSFLLDTMSSIKDHGHQWRPAQNVPVEKAHAAPPRPGSSMSTASTDSKARPSGQSISSAASSAGSTTSSAKQGVIRQTTRDYARELEFPETQPKDFKKKWVQQSAQQGPQPDSKTGRKLARKQQAQKLAMELAKLEEMRIEGTSASSTMDDSASLWGSEANTGASTDDWGAAPWTETKPEEREGATKWVNAVVEDWRDNVPNASARGNGAIRGGAPRGGMQALSQPAASASGVWTRQKPPHMSGSHTPPQLSSLRENSLNARNAARGAAAVRGGRGGAAIGGPQNRVASGSNNQSAAFRAAQAAARAQARAGPSGTAGTSAASSTGSVAASPPASSPAPRANMSAAARAALASAAPAVPRAPFPKYSEGLFSPPTAGTPTGGSPATSPSAATSPPVASSAVPILPPPAPLTASTLAAANAERARAAEPAPVEENGWGWTPAKMSTPSSPEEVKVAPSIAPSSVSVEDQPVPEPAEEYWGWTPPPPPRKEPLQSRSSPTPSGSPSINPTTSALATVGSHHKPSAAAVNAAALAAATTNDASSSGTPSVNGDCTATVASDKVVGEHSDDPDTFTESVNVGTVSSQAYDDDEVPLSTVPVDSEIVVSSDEEIELEQEVTEPAAPLPITDEIGSGISTVGVRRWNPMALDNDSSDDSEPESD